MKKVIALGIVAALATTGFAASLSEGTQEVVVSGLLDPTTAAGTHFDLGVKYGTFIQDAVEVGVFADYSDNDNVTRYGLGGFGEYNFDQGTEVVPYVGASLGYFNADPKDVDSVDGLEVTGEAGVKYFLAENVAISAAAVAKWASDDIYPDDNDVKDSDFIVQIAMRFFLPAAGGAK